jgi:hypothetical protein
VIVFLIAKYAKMLILVKNAVKNGYYNLKRLVAIKLVIIV